MFIKPVLKHIKSTGEYKRYYRLVESYRINDTVRHHTIVQLGSLEGLGDIEQIRMLGLRIESLVKESRTGKQNLFPPGESIIEDLAQKFFLERKDKNHSFVYYALM